MPLRIFHTADLHIGMKFTGYPEPVKTELQLARVKVLEKMVEMSNQRDSNLFVLAGDLFNGISGIDKKMIARVAAALETFRGEAVLVLPGNHDYDNGMIDLWKNFRSMIASSDRILFLDAETPVPLAAYGLNATVYPAPCHAQHDANNLGWIKTQTPDPAQFNIGIAHGAIAGISPDLENEYYLMTTPELLAIPVDVWLLGHTHITYPAKATAGDWRIFNPGTPEPDGIDCSHGGIAWEITIDDAKNVASAQIPTGIHQFADESFAIRDKTDLDSMRSKILKDSPAISVVRLTLNGRVDEDTFAYRREVLKSIEDAVLLLTVNDSGLRIRITSDLIRKVFSDGSFPQQLLAALADDEDALQIAYELIREVKK